MTDATRDAYERYKHLDQLLSDTVHVLPESFPAKVIADLWAAVKESALDGDPDDAEPESMDLSSLRARRPHHGIAEAATATAHEAAARVVRDLLALNAEAVAAAEAWLIQNTERKTP